MDTDTLLGFTASQWTAIGTITLSVITGFYLYFTRRLSIDARRSAEAAERSVLASTAVLFDVVPKPQTMRAGTQCVTTIRLRNTSANPAINVGLLSIADGPSGPDDKRDVQTWFAVLGAGQQENIMVPIEAPPGWEPAAWDFTVTADDLAGNHYILSAQTQPQMAGRTIVTSYKRVLRDGTVETLIGS